MPSEITIYPWAVYEIYGAIAVVLAGYFVYKKVARIINRS